MAITVNKEGPYYTTVGTAISFSSLRTNFKGTNSGAVSASQLRKDTSTDSTDPTVPDATENVNISTYSNLQLSQFRNSIKKYIITQSTNNENAETNFDIDAQNWNSNLGKNVQKIFKVTGVIGATNIDSTSVTVEADICNLEIDVSGNILGAGGITAGSKGGSALYVSNTTQRTVNNKIKININANGKIYSGGDAGTDGSAGNANSIECNSSTTNSYTRANVSGNASSSCSQTTPLCDPGDVDNACAGFPGNESDNCSNQSRRCYRVWVRYCTKTTTTSGNVTSNGGNAGTFGVGRGYNNQETSLAGNGGNNATEVTCNNTGSTTTGNAGNGGNDGTEWGSGKAIFGNSYNITGSTITTVKGTTT